MQIHNKPRGVVLDASYLPIREPVSRPKVVLLTRLTQLEYANSDVQVSPQAAPVQDNSETGQPVTNVAEPDAEILEPEQGGEQVFVSFVNII